MPIRAPYCLAPAFHNALASLLCKKRVRGAKTCAIVPSVPVHNVHQKHAPTHVLPVANSRDIQPQARPVSPNQHAHQSQCVIWQLQWSEGYLCNLDTVKLIGCRMGIIDDVVKPCSQMDSIEIVGKRL